ncbi:MAG: hypothetical protein K6A30_00515 [Lachnospiraceae bacterium]|nr:hypothetical protein [Lachnospiraceae bacterium]
MRIYSIKRPINTGTYPRSNRYQVLEIRNFEKKDYVPEIDSEAWGYIDYESDVPENILKNYELVSQEYIILENWKNIYKAFSVANLQNKGPKEIAVYLSKKMSSQILKNCFAAYIQVKHCNDKISNENIKWLEKGRVKEKVEANDVLNHMNSNSIQPVYVNQLINELRKCSLG